MITLAPRHLVLKPLRNCIFMNSDCVQHCFVTVTQNQCISFIFVMPSEPEIRFHTVFTKILSELLQTYDKNFIKNVQSNLKQIVFIFIYALFTSGKLITL